MAKWTGRINFVSLIPFAAEPKIESISRAWIFDPQWWDAAELRNSGLDSHISDEVQAKRCGRVVVVFLGSAHTGKGIGHFLRLWNTSADIRNKYIFVIGGRVDPFFSNELADFLENGGIAYNRFVTDAELGSLYELSDLVWVFYEPSYDQSSGIFGRALIANKTPIVRRSSRLSVISRILSILTVELDGDPTAADFIRLAVPSQGDGPSTAEMRRISLETISKLL